MPINCLIPSQAEKLKRALRKDKRLRMSNLFNMSSADRIKLFSKYLDPDAAKLFVSKLEKAYMSPNQKLAMRNLIMKEIGQGKPLYKGLTLDQSKEMGKNLNMRDIKKMSSEDRIKTLSKYVGKDMATSLNDRFLKLKKSGNLQNWEERTLGTDIIKQDKVLKGELAKLEALDDLGVLTPDQVETFMQSFVETKIGASLSVPEAKELSGLINKSKTLFDEWRDKGGTLIPKNEKVFTDYLLAVQDIKAFAIKTTGYDFKKVANTLIDIGRAHILFALKTPVNSAMYQITPTLERYISGKITPQSVEKELNVSMTDKIMSQLSGIKIPKELKQTITDQIKMGIRIYHKTGYDISRMETLQDGERIFGGERFRFYPKMKISEGKRTIDKLGIALGNYARFANLGPKWGAGGTDMIIANFMRAENTIIRAQVRASLETKKNKLPKGVNQKERVNQLIEDSYSFQPKDVQAQNIRASSILDAQTANNTQPDALADKLINVRDEANLGELSLGKLFVPFAKIASTAISKGIQAQTGIGPAKALYNLSIANKKLKGPARQKAMNKSTTALVSMLGFIGAAFFIASFLDDDDYVPPYLALGYKEYSFAKARGANPGEIRLFGKWFSLRYLPAINMPLMSIMEARRRKNLVSGYLGGLGLAISDLPVLRDIIKFGDKVLTNTAKQEKAKDLLKSAGLDGEGIMEWLKVRAVPRLLSKEVYETYTKQDVKYDFLGREIAKTTIKPWRDDKTNHILIEFSELDKSGNMPVISNPSGDYAVELEEKLGEEKYYEELSELQQKYAEKVLDIINRGWYSNLSDEKKKKKIDEIRQEYILNKLKSLNKKTNY